MLTPKGWIERYIQINDLDSQARIGIAIMKLGEPLEDKKDFFHQCFLYSVIENFSDQWQLLAQHFELKTRKNFKTSCLKFIKELETELNFLTSMPGQYLLVENSNLNSFGILYREYCKPSRKRLKAKKWVEENLNIYKLDYLADEASYTLMRYGVKEIKAYLMDLCWASTNKDIWDKLKLAYDLRSKNTTNKDITLFAGLIANELNQRTQLHGIYSLNFHTIDDNRFGIYYYTKYPDKSDPSFHSSKILPRTKLVSERMFGPRSFTDEIKTVEEAKAAVEYFSHNEIKFRKELSEEYLEYDDIQHIVRNLWLNLLISCRRVGYQDYIVDSKEQLYKMV